MSLYALLGFLPRDLKHYRKALTHSSIATGHNKRLSNNERLEYLGDAVLSSITSDYLYRHYRKEREGFLSKSRSRIVCRESLNNIALQIGLDKLVVAADVGHQHNSYIYGNAFEALIGAIYIDRGYDYCRSFLFDKVFANVMDVENVAKADNNFKSRLIEWSQKNRREVTFVLVKEEIRHNGSFFASEVHIDGEMYGSGEGFSKRESQQNAAKEALQRLLR